MNESLPSQKNETPPVRTDDVHLIVCSWMRGGPYHPGCRTRKGNSERGSRCGNGWLWAAPEARKIRKNFTRSEQVAIAEAGEAAIEKRERRGRPTTEITAVAHRLRNIFPDVVATIDVPPHQ